MSGSLSFGTQEKRRWFDSVEVAWDFLVVTFLLINQSVNMPRDTQGRILLNEFVALTAEKGLLGYLGIITIEPRIEEVNIIAIGKASSQEFAP